MGKPKDHHWVPKVYLKSWCYKNKSIFQYENKNVEKNEPKNIDNILFKRHLYSKKIEDIFIIDESKWEQECIDYFQGLTIYHEGQKLECVRDYLGYFEDYDNWHITRESKETSKSEKNRIKNKLLTWFDCEVEYLLNKEADNYWDDIITMINDKIINGRSITKYPYYKDDISRILTLQYFRNPHPKEIDVIKIIDEFKLPIPEKYLNKIKRNLWLKQIEDFLNSDKENLVSKFYDEILKLKFIFLVANSGNFITSDRPVNLVLGEDRIKGIYYPITPNVMLFLTRNSNKSCKYTVIDIDLEHVKFINDSLIICSYGYVYSNFDNLKEITGSNITKEKFLRYMNRHLKRINVIINDINV